MITRTNLKPFCRLGLLSAVALVSMFFVASVVAEDSTPSEHQVKAAFLVNFPKYVDWPAEAFADKESPIVIAVLGETKVVEELTSMVKDRRVNGREIILKSLSSGEQPPRDCHILFMAATEQRNASGVLARLAGTSILTVGESNDFLEGGGMINLVQSDRKIALAVNLTATSKARLKISSKLLNVAKVVKGRQD